MFALLNQTVGFAKNSKVVDAVLSRLNLRSMRRQEKTSPPQRKKIMFEGLEPRLLLSADLLPGAGAVSGDDVGGVMAFSESGGPQINIANVNGAYQEVFINSRDVGNFTSPLVALPPNGSLVYAGGVEGYADAETVGSHSVELAEDQYFSLRLRPASGDLQARIDISAPGWSGWSQSGTSGQELVWQPNDAQEGGTFSIMVSSLNGTSGNYELDIFLNAGLEVGDATMSNVPDISLFALDLSGDGNIRADVIGRIDYTPQGAIWSELYEDFDYGGLDANWSTDGWGPGYTGWRADDYGGEGLSAFAAYAGGYLAMEGGDGYGGIAEDSLHLATLRLDLENVSDASIEFYQYGWDPSAHGFDGEPFTGTQDADGVAFSVDGGDVWYPLVDFDGSYWHNNWYYIDLAESAQDWDVTLSANTLIRFQFHDDVWANGGYEYPQNGYRNIDSIYVYSVRAGDILPATVQASDQDYFGDPELLTDGYLPEYDWNQSGNSVWWLGQSWETQPGALAFTFDLGAPVLLTDLILSVDHDDDYLIEASLDGQNWSYLAQVLAEEGRVDWGMQRVSSIQADNTFVPSLEFNTSVVRHLRIMASGGDGLYAVGEVQAIGQSGEQDYYSLALTAGVPVSLTLTHADVGVNAGLLLELLNEYGEVLAVGRLDMDGLAGAIENFIPALGGSYFVRVSGAVRGEYNLTATHDLTFAPAGLPAQDLTLTRGQALGGFGALGEDYRDYAVSSLAGDALQVEVAPLAQDNTLIWSIQVFDPDGIEVAKNGDDAYSATADGAYTVRIVRDAGQGDYHLSVAGFTGAAGLPEFVVAGSSMDGVDRTANFPGWIDISFNAPILATSLDDLDLTLNGQSVHGPVLLDADTVRWHVVDFVGDDGDYLLELAESALTSVHGVGNQMWQQMFNLDRTGPLADSALQGQVVASGVTEIQVDFNEALDAAGLGVEDVELVRARDGVVLPIIALNYDPDLHSLTVGFDPLLEDGAYSLLLRSGAEGFRDSVGNPLDGDADGVPGGDYLLNFGVDVGDGDSPYALAAFQHALPLGSMLYLTGTAGMIQGAADTDAFTFELPGGPESLSILLVQDNPSLKQELELTLFDLNDPDNFPNGVAIRQDVGAPGAGLLFNNWRGLAAGNYRVEVYGSNDAGGAYQLHLFLNAMAEEEAALHDANNDSRENAQSIDDSFIDLGRDGSRMMLVGDRHDPLSGIGEPIFNPQNGHYYWLVNDFAGDPAPDWDVARDLAANTVFKGVNGHLATITSADENRFLTDFFGGDGLDGIFLGGYQPPESSEPDGNWSWANGEWFPQFNNWGPDEPNNSGEEHYMTYAHDVDAEGKQWNDTVIDGGSGYLVEFDWGWQQADDWYKFSASAGESISVDVKFLDSGNWDIHVGLYDDDGALITQSVWDMSPDGSRVIQDAIAQDDAEYYLRVSGSAAGMYSLVVTKGLSFNVPSSAWWLSTSGQDIGVTDQALGYAVEGVVPGQYEPRPNEYLFHAEADQYIEFQTELPLESLGNTLDAQIFIYDAIGNLVAEDQNSLDGKNALAGFTASVSGLYRVVVSSESGSGEYVLRANVDVASKEGAPTLWWTFPYQDQNTTLPSSIEIILYQAVDASSLDVGDLLIDWGTVDSVELTAGNRVRFDITPNAELGEGEYSFTLVNHAFVGLNGMPGPDFGGDHTVTFNVDMTGPQVIQTRTNGELPLNRVDFIFNEELDDWTVGIDDVQYFYDPYGNDLLSQIYDISVDNEWIYDEETESDYYRSVVSVHFYDQYTDGIYEIGLGPDIQDRASNSMDEIFDARVGVTLSDLTVTDILLRDPDTYETITSASIDSYIYLDWTVLNPEPATFDPLGNGWYDAVWLSTDAVLDRGSDIYLTDYWFNGPLSGGDSYTQSDVYVYFSHYDIAGAGDYYLIVEADAGDDQAESDENNNWLAVPITLLDPITPDLTVDNVQFTPTSPEQGTSINVSWTVSNIGEASVGHYSYTSFFLSDDAIWDASDLNIHNYYHYTSLSPGNSANLSRSMTLPSTVSGDKYVIVVADYYNYIYEGAGEGGQANYAGNNHAASATPLDIVAPTDDLAIQSFTLTAPAIDNVYFGNTLSLEWVVENIGSSDTSNIWYDRVYLSRDAIFDGSDLYLGQQYINVSPLSPEETYTQTALNFRLPLNENWSDGTYYLLLRVDYNNHELESDENNNLASIPVNIAVPPLANLVVSNVATPVLFEQGKPVQFNWTLENIGDATAVGYNGSWIDYIYLSRDDIFGNGDDSFVASVTNTQSIASGATLDRSYNYTTTSQLIGQSYYVFVRTDGNNQVYEGMDGGEEDNVGRSDGSVTFVVPGEDLVIDSVTAPADVVLGQAFNVSWIGSNAGSSATAFTWTDRVVLSIDAIYGNGDDVYLGQISVNGAPLPLDTGETYSRNLNVTIPLSDSYADGLYYLFVVADVNNSEPESNNSNNFSAAFEINASVPPLPDMVVTSVTAPEAAESGKSITVNWTVKNQGGAATTRGYWYDLIVLSTDPTWSGDDTWVASYILRSGNLAAGASVDRSHTFTLPAGLVGDYYIVVKTDMNGLIYERLANENNNDRANDWNNDGESDLTHIVLPNENLDVINFNAPSTAVFGNSVDLNWTVKNIGTGTTAATTWYDQVWLSTNQTLETGTDHNLGTLLRSGALAASAEYTASKTFTLPLSSSFSAGTYYFIVKTDSNNNAPETSETDNVEVSGLVTISVPPLPNITISNVVFDPANTFTNQNVSVTFTVNNIGTDATTGNFYNRVWLSTDTSLNTNTDIMLAEAVFDQTLGSGASATRTITALLPIQRYGNWYVLVQGDNYNQINEYTGENDNLGVSAAVLVATLPPLPDLSITNNTIVAPAEAIAGQVVPITWTITNAGEAAVSGWADYVYLSTDNSIGSDTFMGSFVFNGVLNPGDSVTRTQNITLPANQQGDRWVVVRSDTSNAIYESREDNNSAIDQQKMAVRLPPLPNLQVQSVTAPNQAFSGQQTVVQWVVTNTGTGDTSVPTWYDYVYLSTDGVLDGTDTYLGAVANPSYLAVGDSYASQLTVTLPQGIQGNYSIIVKTDGVLGSNGNVFEDVNEGDNVKSDGMSVSLTPPPDLRVTTVGAVDSLSGQPLVVNWTVANAGEGSTRVGSWYDRVYLSTDAVFDAADSYLGQTWHNGVLAAGEQYNAAATVTLPIGVEGDFFVLVVTDFYDSVYEHASEGNNTGDKAITVALTPPPDLEAEIVSLPTSVRSGTHLAIDYSVFNYGATPTPNASWSDRFWLSTDTTLVTSGANQDILLGSVGHWGALADGAGYNATANFGLSNAVTGVYYVFMTTDADNSVFELNNANNTARSLGAVSIASTPANLVVSAATLPADGESGKQIAVQWTVTNQGSGDTIVHQWQDRIGLSLDDVFGDDDDIVLASVTHSGLLDVGTSYTASANVTLPFSVVGDYRLYVRTDVNNAVYEGLDENDNASFGTIAISRVTPDLVPTIGVLPDAATGGETLQVHWRVDNQGLNQTNVFSWYDDVWLSLDTTLNTATDINLGSYYRNAGLAGGAGYDASLSLSKALPIGIASGDYYVIVRTDRDNGVIEGDGESNNIAVSDATIAITSGVVLVPNLRVTNVQAPATGIGGQPIEVSWTVNNDGDDTAARWYDSIYLSADPFFDRNGDIYLGYLSHAGGLSSGASYSETRSFTLPASYSGLYYVFVDTDSGRSVVERDEFDNAAYDSELLSVQLAQPADLTVGSITVPANATPGLNATIQFSIHNDSDNAAVGNWKDSIYLSSDAIWDVNDVLFANVQKSHNVAAHSSYSETVTAELPGLTPGDYYVIIRSDILNQLPESNNANNIGASLDVAAVDVQALTLGEAANGVLNNGKAVYYKVDVGAGETLVVNLDAAAEGVANELYLRYGEMPSRTVFDQGYTDAFSADQRIIVHSTRAGTYYIMAYASAGGSAFSLEADVLEFSIQSVSPVQGSNQGQVTVALEGAKFPVNGQVSLIADDGTTALVADRVWWVDGSTLWATFDLRGTALGVYDIQIEGDGQLTRAPGAFTVNDNPAGELKIDLQVPVSLRPDRGGVVVIEYVNDGDTDIVAPLIGLSADYANFKAPGASEFGGNSLQFYAINREGPAGILTPGTRGSIQVAFMPTIGDGRVSFSAFAVGGDIVIDWEALQAAYRPSHVEADAWDVLWEEFKLSIGDTFTDYMAVMSDNATHLAALGRYVDDLGALLQFELLQVGAGMPKTLLESATDLSLPAPGQDLVMTRYFDGSLIGRNQQGSLGWGWNTFWDMRADTDAAGNVNIITMDGMRAFLRQDDGSYLGAGGERASLTLVGGGYRMAEPDGTLLIFRPDGRLDALQDHQGNVIDVTYDGDGNMSGLVAGVQSFVFSHDAAGRIVSVTDSAGRSVTYAYDVLGHLISVSGPAGVTTYDYDSVGASRSQLHALTGVTSAAGVVRGYEYDSHGRLVREAIGGSEIVEYGYGSAAETRIEIDATGFATTLLYNELGRVSRVGNSAGQVNAFMYDDRGNLTDFVLQNLLYNNSFNAAGNLIGTQDPLGNQRAYSYGDFDRLTGITDANGNAMQYAYDANGNLNRITYADGSRVEYSYDAAGNLASMTNARGQVTTYVYDASGRATQRTLDDGSRVEYAYDAAGNLLTVNAYDTAGSLQETVSFVYDAASRMTQANYPNGRSLSYTYDADGRRASIADQDGNWVNYTYDSAGRLLRAADTGDATLAAFSYDVAGRLVEKQFGNGVRVEYTYDAGGLLKTITHLDTADTVLSFFHYEHDLLGRPVSVATESGDWAYEYSVTGRLTGAVFTSTDAGVPSRSLSYDYDAEGNRISMTLDGVTTLYSVNALNQYSSVGGQAYSYDADGNLLSDGVTTYTYDSLGQLISADDGVDSLQLEYNALGLLVGVADDGVWTRYLVDANGWPNPVASYDQDGDALASYRYALGLLGQSIGADASYFGFDYTGNLVNVFDADGGEASTYLLDPFGDRLYGSEIIGSPFDFVGQSGILSDTELDLSMMRARVYDADTGRFLSRDPVGHLGGINLYDYVGGASTYLIDPTGLWYISIGVSGGFWGGGGGAIQIGSNGIYFQGAAGATSPGVGVGVTFSPDGTPSPGWGGSVQGAVGPGVVGVAGALNFDGNGYAGTEVGVGIGLGGSKVTGGAAFVTYTTPIWEWNPQPPANPNPGPQPGGPNDNGNTNIVRPVDPNDILGPVGYGDENWIPAGDTFAYTIRFENDAIATAPAQQVIVTQQLDADLDWRTFRVDDFGFGDFRHELGADKAFFSQTLDLTESHGFLLRAVINIDTIGGLATWTLTTLDPATGETPEDASVGFLPPNDDSGRGDGFVSYTIKALKNIGTGAVVDATATIVFDTEGPIETPPIFNTLDAGVPSSSVNALTDSTLDTQFLVTWSGSDDAAGSGLASFDLFVATDGGDFSLWLENTTLTEAEFFGVPGQSYAFYSIARDNAGNREKPPAMPDAQIEIIQPNTPPDAVDDGPFDLHANTSLQVSVLDNDSDADLDGLTVIANSQAGNGLVEHLGGSLFIYTPNVGYVGTDSFSYTISDGIATDTATVSFNVTNIAPDAEDDGPFDLHANTSLQVSVLDNDSDADLDGLTVIANSQAGNGLVEHLGGSLFIYTPNANYVGTDSFSYTISDGIATDTATVSFNVTNTAPDAVDDGVYTLDANTSLEVDVLGNDSDADGDALSVIDFTQADHGLVEDLGGGLFRYTPNTGYVGADSFGYTMSDGIETSFATVSFNVDAFRVTGLTPTATGYHVRFNHALDASQLNLYDAADYGLGAADAVLKDGANKVVAGSIVLDSDNQGYTFIKTGNPKTNGLLASGVYSLTLESRANGLVDTQGRLLDGDLDGNAGGNHTAQFGINGSGAILSLGEFARGPGQDINLPASGSGLPIKISNAAGITRLSFNLSYDASLLDITGATSTLAGSTLTADLSVAGQISIEISGIVGLTNALTDVVRLTANVPASVIASQYGAKHLLDLGNLQAWKGGTEVSLRDDDGLHVVAYLGDTTGNAAYSTYDVSQLQRVLVRLDSGFGAYPLADPAIIGNVTANGTLSALDTRLLMQKVQGIAQTAIPAIPAGIDPITYTGADPLVSLPTVDAKAGDTVTIPVQLDTAAGLASVQLTLAYSAADLELVDVRLGDLALDFGWFVKDSQAGKLTIDMSRLHALSGGSGKLLELDFKVAATAKGTLALDLQWAQLNETRLTLNPAPQIGADPTDGAIRVKPAPVVAAVQTRRPFVNMAERMIDFGLWRSTTENAWVSQWVNGPSDLPKKLHGWSLVLPKVR